ncbi:hypothetical protein ANCCAN_28304 [Ancylostoma caninum]|uniref:SET domain-containing protein n=1 Tax=Ancylostoma caninum TaxID=29170 RepID=A0A368F4Q9_ANCCA|nr:hypothetical protein ANCCAN_28304 [Ancylostoma caninum]
MFNDEGSSRYSSNHEVKAGEQLLWNYGNKYRGAQLRKNYICNACDPVLNAASTLDLCGSTGSAAEPQEPKPSKEEPSMSQHVSGWQRAPLSTRHLLLSVAMEANVVGLIAPHEGYSGAEDAYQRGREFVSGREGRFVGMLTFPGCGNRLCRLLNATYTDAFKEGRPVVLILRRRFGPKRVNHVVR